MQLREKQKAKFLYGLMERQFRRIYQRAAKERGVTGERLLQLLELRLDNIVFRLGLAQTRYQSRQFVSHGFVEVDGKKVDIPSFEVKPGQTIAIRENKKDKKVWEQLKLRLAKYRAPEWLELDSKNLSGKVLTVPTGNMLETRINPQLIVEHYSR